MDDTQLMAFCDYMIGERSLGGTPEDPIGTPYSPELRAFIVGRLGMDTPDSGYSMIFATRYPNAKHSKKDDYIRQTKAFAAMLREVADILDPKETILPAPSIIDALKNCVNHWPAALSDDLQERTHQEAIAALAAAGIEP